nr:AAA family ATPase [Burkholderia cepacia]
MITVDLPALFERLNALCRHALEEAGSLCIGQRGAEVTVPHLLVKLLDQPQCDVRLVLRVAGIEVDTARHALSTAFPEGGSGHNQYPSFSPLLVELLQEAWLLSSVELGQAEIRSGALLLAVLLNPGRYLPLAAIRLLDGVSREPLRKRFGELLAGSTEAADTASADHRPAGVGGDDSALARFGHDFTAQAREGWIDPVLCRDTEIDLLVDILSRRRKNNPIVVGDAGVGKSAVVEGLALRIVQARVPEPLRDVHLWGLDLGALQAGASVKGEFEKRLKAVIDEVKASPQPIILFIDEAHTLIGAGNAAGGSDAANLLKPALARGELRTIAATTWSEYKKYFEKDPALVRRFQLVKLEEPSPEDAVHILRGLRPLYEQAHKVYIGDDDDGGVFELGGEEVLLLALGRRAIPLHFHFGEHFTGGQGLVQQRRGLVERRGEDERLVHTLARRLAALRVGRRGDQVFDFLDQDLVLVTFLIDVADGVGREGALRDVALGLALDADISGSRHGCSPCCWNRHGRLTVLPSGDDCLRNAMPVPIFSNRHLIL